MISPFRMIPIPKFKEGIHEKTRDCFHIYSWIQNFSNSVKDHVEHLLMVNFGLLVVGTKVDRFPPR